MNRSRNDLLDADDASAGELERLILGQAGEVAAGLHDIAAADFSRLEVQARGWCSIVQANGQVG